MAVSDASNPKNVTENFSKDLKLLINYENHKFWGYISKFIDNAKIHIHI